MTVIVLINGEKQSGKSTLAEHAANLLMENGIMAKPYSLVGPYRPMLESLFESIYGEDTPGYNDLKDAVVVDGLPFTGRDWMIQVGNASRALHPYFLPAIFAQKARLEPEISVWLIENWGFQDEWEFFTEPDVKAMFPKLITVSLTKRSTRQYQSGEQYDGDNRFNLDSLADVVDPAVNALCAMIDPNHEYPVDTILQQFGSEVDEATGDMHADDAPASDLVTAESELENQPSEALPTAESETNRDQEADARVRAEDDGQDV